MCSVFVCLCVKSLYEVGEVRQDVAQREHVFDLFVVLCFYLLWFCVLMCLCVRLGGQAGCGTKRTRFWLPLVTLMPSKACRPYRPPISRDDDDCCLFSHEKTLGLFDRKKTTQKQKQIETTIIKTFTTSPNSNEILVKYKTQVKGSWKTFSHNKSWQKALNSTLVSTMSLLQTFVVQLKRKCF